MTIEREAVKTVRIINFAKQRLGLPDIVESTYVDISLWQRKEIRQCLQERLGQGIGYYDFWGWLISEIGQTKIKNFADTCKQNQLMIQNLSNQLKNKNNNPTLTPGQKTTNRYFVEYALSDELQTAGYNIQEVFVSCAQLPIYDSWSPSINEKDPFDKLVLGSSCLGKKIPQANVLDVAAGRGRFSQFLNNSYGVPTNNCLCVDISSTSTVRTGELGFPSITGDIKKIALQQTDRSFDLIYLGYCIDRDDQPKETIRQIRSLLALGGVLILEGLLPVVPQDSLGTIYTAETDRIAKGESLVTDVLDIAGFVENNGIGLKLSSFALGPKLVRSLDGPELLSSSTFVFERK